MKLKIDQFMIEARPDESLYEMVARLGLLSGSLATDPIASGVTRSAVFKIDFNS